jgi:hypothetical protein
LELKMGKIIALGTVGVLLIGLAVYAAVLKPENPNKGAGLGLPGTTATGTGLGLPGYTK